MKTLRKITIRHWIYGAVAAFISGGAGAVTSSMTASMIAPQAFNMGSQLGNFVKLAATTFIISGCMGMFTYFKQSPLPVEVEEAPTENK